MGNNFHLGLANLATRRWVGEKDESNGRETKYVMEVEIESVVKERRNAVVTLLENLRF